MNSPIYKIKDSVDLFLSDGTYIMAYFMNTRHRKTFKVNKELVSLLELIDGEKSLSDIYEIMESNHNVKKEQVDTVINSLCLNKIITVINENNDILNADEIKRFDRQINYFTEFLGSEEEGIKAQKQLMDSKILIFGCGAIGGDIAIELTMAGVNNIIIYDYDFVENSDKARHMYYEESTIGIHKTEALKARLKKINSNLNIQCIMQSMKPETKIEEIIKDCDFVVNTLDEPYIGYTSSKISRVCMKYSIPHYIAGGFDAHLASTGEIVIPYVTPCVECYSSHFKEKLKNWKPKEHPVKTRYTEIGGMASMSLFSASYAVIEIIKYIAGLTDTKNSFKVRGEFLFTDMSLTYLEVNKNANCPICGGRTDES